MVERNEIIHNCTNNSKIQSYKKSINDSKFTYEQIAMIMDFYITRNIACSTELAITLEQYGWNKQKNGSYDYKKIEEQLKEVASVEKFICVRAKTIKDTLNLMHLAGDNICIEHPRIVLMQDYNLTIDEFEQTKLESKESRIKCLFRHIRNSLAHGDTFFFDNGNLLLEDKDKSTITARILINQQTLIDWIKVIDKECKRYTIKSFK